MVILRSGPHVMQPPFASSPPTQVVTNTNQNAAEKSTFMLPELFGAKKDFNVNFPTLLAK